MNQTKNGHFFSVLINGKVQILEINWNYTLNVGKLRNQIDKNIKFYTK